MSSTKKTLRELNKEYREINPNAPSVMVWSAAFSEGALKKFLTDAIKQNKLLKFHRAKSGTQVLVTLE